MLDFPKRLDRVVLGGIGWGGAFRAAAEIAKAMRGGPIESPIAQTFYNFAKARPSNDLEALAACILGPQPEPDIAALAAIKNPVLVVVGDQDDIVTHVDRLVESIPTAKLVTIAGRNHMSAVPARRFQRGSAGFPRIALCECRIPLIQRDRWLKRTLRLVRVALPVATIEMLPSGSSTPSCTSLTSATPCSRIAVSTSSWSTPSFFMTSRQVLAVLDDHGGRRRQQPVKAREPVQPADAGVGQHQREDEHQAAADRVVRPGDRRLQGVGDQQDEDQVVERELPDLALAEDAQCHQQGDVDEHRTNDQLPSGNARQQGRKQCRLRSYLGAMRISAAGPRRTIHSVGKMQPTIGSIIFNVA